MLPDMSSWLWSKVRNLGSTQPPLQSSVPAWHAHLPEMQDNGAPQACPHVPQLALSVLSEAQYGGSVLALASHSVMLEPHVAAHSPATQAVPTGQRLSHAPQWALSVRVSTQCVAAPGVLPGHSLSSAAQVVAQVPCEQTCPALQACPHVPQLASSVCSGAQ